MLRLVGPLDRKGWVLGEAGSSSYPGPGCVSMKEKLNSHMQALPMVVLLSVVSQ